MSAAMLAAIGLMVAACGAGSVASVDGHTTDSDGVSEPVPDSTPEPTVAEPTTGPSTTTEQTTGPSRSAVPASALTTTEPTTAAVRTGAEQLVADDLELLRGSRVGLIVNQTSVVDGRHLIDHLADHPDVELAAIFAPEHGVRGTADAGEVVGDTVDDGSGVPVYSLYGATQAPTPSQLSGVDVLVYDLQDVGARYYTYVSTMGLSMQSAAKAGIPFVVLDRPDPLGGQTVSGFVRDESQVSFVGLYPTPAIYGLTAGELASAIVAEGWLGDLSGLDLTVVEVAGWERGAPWGDTGIEWIGPSPGLPTVDAATTYGATVLFETSVLSYGKGTPYPFGVVGAAWVDGPALASTLHGLGLPAVRFEALDFVPDPSLTPNPRHGGENLSGVRLVVTEPERFDPIAVGAHLLATVRDHGAERGIDAIIDRPQMFDLLAGTARYRRLLDAGASGAEIAEAWAADVAAFGEIRARYLRY